MKRIKVTALQRANLQSAKRMWVSVPEANVSRDLRHWNSSGIARQEYDYIDPPTCKTISCFGGWCAWWPDFVEQGMFADGSGAPSMSSASLGTFKGVEVSQKLFGSISNLFTLRGWHEADVTTVRSDSDWWVVMNRLNWLRTNSIVSPKKIDEHKDLRLQIITSESYLQIAVSML